MTDYRVKLEVYNGPMDLLLYLIRRDEIDIYDLPVAKITSQYMDYMNLMEELDVDLAGEFLVMAATLMELKSLMVIPRDEVEGEEGEDDPTDPRMELIHQLLEYKRFKDAAGMLEDAAEERAGRFHRPLVDLERVKKELKSEQELDMESVQVWDLMDAFTRLMKATLANNKTHNVIHDDTPIDIYETMILSKAQKANPLKFEAVFERASNREEMVGMFLAILELMRHRLIKIEQEKAFGDIYIFPQTDMDAKQAVLNTISGANIQEEEEELLNEVGIAKPEEEKLFSESISITEDLGGFSEGVRFTSDEEAEQAEEESHFADDEWGDDDTDEFDEEIEDGGQEQQIGAEDMDDLEGSEVEGPQGEDTEIADEVEESEAVKKIEDEVDEVSENDDTELDLPKE